METAADSSSADDTAARSTSSATATAAPPAATNESSDDSSFDSSGAGAESAGDSPQGKSDVVQSRQDGGFYMYPTRGRVAQNERDTQRETRKLNGGCSVVGGPSGVSTGRQKPSTKPRSVAP